jgi:hypothetical protein
MLLFGCLIAFAVALAPRVVLILAALFSERWSSVWGGNWLWPLLGIIFAPYTTVMYMLVWTPVAGITGFDWLWLALGVLLDIMKWGQIINNRRGVPGYPQGSQAQPGATHYAEKELSAKDQPEPQAATGTEETSTEGTSAEAEPAADEGSVEAG